MKKFIIALTLLISPSLVFALGGNSYAVGGATCKFEGTIKTDVSGVPYYCNSTTWKWTVANIVTTHALGYGSTYIASRTQSVSHSGVRGAFVSGCRTRNLFTNSCSCPSGTTSSFLRTTTYTVPPRFTPRHFSRAAYARRARAHGYTGWTNGSYSLNSTYICRWKIR